MRVAGQVAASNESANETILPDPMVPVAATAYRGSAMPLQVDRDKYTSRRVRLV